eukprot:56083_1
MKQTIYRIMKQRVQLTQNLSDYEANNIYLKIVFGQGYTYDVICGILWFEKRQINAHLAYDLCQRLLIRILSPITMDSFSENVMDIMKGMQSNKRKSNQM